MRSARLLAARALRNLRATPGPWTRRNLAEAAMTKTRTSVGKPAERFAKKA